MVESDRDDRGLLGVDDNVGDSAANRFERGVRFTNPFFHPIRRADGQVALETSDLQGERGDRLSGLGAVLDT